MDYLQNFEKYCDLKSLQSLKAERETWLQRDQWKKFAEVLNSLPQTEKKFSIQENKLILQDDNLTNEDREKIIQSAKLLLPWKKGPFSLFGEEIDAEWRSDFKWERIRKHLDDVHKKNILDIGCNNGYFMFQLLSENPYLALGIDPVLINKAQFDFINHFVGAPNLKFELFGVEHVPYFKGFFDIIMSMGIIYHHRHPIQQLVDMREALKPNGQLIIETIGIPGDEPHALFPEDRYANMKNIWFIPTISCLINWVKKARFIDVEIISDTLLTPEEQRITDWCPPTYQSLSDYLDPNDSSKTIEGFPAPRRFCLKARKKKGQ